MTVPATADVDFRVMGGAAARDLTIVNGVLATVGVQVGPRQLSIARATELALVLDTATWRHDIATWRWRTTTDAGTAFADPALDDSSWRVVPHLQPVFDATTAETSWFRTDIPVSQSVDSPLRLVLGGLDDEDWSSYDVFLDGRHVDGWQGFGRIREPRSIVLEPSDLCPSVDGSTGRHLLAVRASGLNRAGWQVQPGEREHYFYQGWLLDQYVAGGNPTSVVDDFVATAYRRDGDGDGAEIVELRSTSLPDLSAELRYSGFRDGVRKAITIHNSGSTPVTILDVIVDSWEGPFPTAGGGRGQPIFLGDDGFIGIEHPAGVNQADNGRVRCVQMPGITIGSGASWSTRTIVIGGSTEGRARAAFREYVRELRPRQTMRKRVYSALGWYDFTNPADPLPELTAGLVTENLEQLGSLRDLGAEFDIYMIDDWWESDDLGSFRTRTFPGGAASIGQQIRDAGMEAGLWWATSRALWTAADAPGIEYSEANAPGIGRAVALAGGEWRWLEEFGNLFIGERRFCLAAEPYRTQYTTAIPTLAEELELALLKLDCVVLHCTSSDHDHRAGRHSVEPMIDSLVTLLERCLTIRPDLRIVWYWGFRSPWFLAFGDMVFDKGLLMEAATPSSAPLPTSRQAMSLNVDQAIEHAAELPLELQDSLGVWVGDVAWCNRVGREEWREAYLLDISRGSDLVQLWGDLTLFDAEDRAFLAVAQQWVERLGADPTPTTRIGGSAWRAEPYGYMRTADGGVLVTVVNPSWSAAQTSIQAALAAVPDGARVVELYPCPGLLAVEGDLDLAPFEIRVVHVLPASAVPRGVGPSIRPYVRTTRTVEPTGLTATGGVAQVSGRLSLPDLGRGDAIYITNRLARDGQWTYDPEPHSRVRLSATLDGLAVRTETVPRNRDRNGPGSSWVLHRIPAGPSWSGRALDLTVDLTLATGVTIVSEAYAVDEWWRRSERRFADPLAR